MKFALLIWAGAFVALYSGLSLANPSPEFHVMLTSFDPFGGNPTNNSQPIAAELKKHAASLGAHIQIDVCNLPVIYDEASVVALQCANLYKPDVVVSLGEGACEVRIETAATNLDDAAQPDNSGQVRSNHEIVSGGPKRSGFVFPVQAMYCAAQKVEVSVAPQPYVCNNTAYHLSQNLRAAQIPFTFIHVPNARCETPYVDPVANAKTIGKMLKAAIAEMKSPAQANSLWPHLGNSNILPTTQEEAESLLLSLELQKAPACEVSFAQQIVSKY